MTTHVCSQITDIKGGQLFYYDAKEKESGVCDINDIISIKLCYTITDKEMKKELCKLSPKNHRKNSQITKLRAKYVTMYSCFVNLPIFQTKPFFRT